MPDGRSALLGLGRTLVRYDMTTGQELGSVILGRDRAADVDVDGAAGRIVYKDRGDKDGSEIIVRDLASGRERRFAGIGDAGEADSVVLSRFERPATGVRRAAC